MALVNKETLKEFTVQELEIAKLLLFVVCNCNDFPVINDIIKYYTGLDKLTIKDLKPLEDKQLISNLSEVQEGVFLFDYEDRLIDVVREYMQSLADKVLDTFCLDNNIKRELISVVVLRVDPELQAWKRLGVCPNINKTVTLDNQ